MSGYNIKFNSSPLLLLLIIPVLAVIFAMFFIGKRRGKCTVNRVLSAVLQSVIAVICIFAMSGICLSYDANDTQNELVILVDSSYTAGRTRERVNELVKETLEENDGRYKTAIVLFGYDQSVALPMGSYDAQTAYAEYLDAIEANDVDDSATDISAALNFVWDPASGKSDFISRPETAKILLISDGLETDESALSTVKNLTRDGISVDTSFFSMGASEDAAIIGATFPDSNIVVGAQIEIKLQIRSAFSGICDIYYEDKDENGAVVSGMQSGIELKMGSQSVVLQHSFADSGEHELTFNLEVIGDGVTSNNVFYAFCEVPECNLVLLIENFQGESSRLFDAVNDKAAAENMKIETIAVAQADFTAEQFSDYNEVILYNVAASDISEELQQALYSYAEDYGGGVFTIGGFEKENGQVVTKPDKLDPSDAVPVGHTYQKEDNESLLASMLPVTIEEYVPSVAVVYVADVSTSMTGYSGSAISYASEDAINSLDLLSPRDYAALIFLEDDYQEVSPMVPMTQRYILEQELKDMVNIWDWDNSTKYAPALKQAVKMLNSCPDDVARKHIVLLSDGGPSDKIDDYGPVIQEAYTTSGITLTVVTYYREEIYFGDDGPYYFNHAYTVKGYEINTERMVRLAEMGGGTMVLNPRKADGLWEDAMIKDMKLEELFDVGNNDFHPHIGTYSAVFDKITDSQLSALTLNGFFPSRERLNGNVDVLLTADSSPLYAEWAFGKGKVGSIMIDLEGYWSSELLSSDVGKEVVSSIIFHLARRVEEVKHTIEATVIEDNYRTQVNVYGFNAEKEKDFKLVAQVSPPTGGEAMFFDLDLLSKTHNRFTFENRSAGLYCIKIMKVPKTFYLTTADVPANVIADEITVYRTFSYSEEYDMSIGEAFGQDLLASLSTRTLAEGQPDYEKFVYSAAKLFDEYKTYEIIKDPRMTMLIVALALYLVDIALRKFRIGRRKNR